MSSNIVFDGNGGRVWVANQDNNTVSVFNAATNAKLAEVAVGAGPRTLAVAPNGSVWVTNKHAATISVIDPSTLTVSQTVVLPYASQPFGIAFAPTGGYAFVALEAKSAAQMASVRTM
jgi:YVTN family beta-propeller protein